MTDWKTKAIIATRGTQLGAILLCALDEKLEQTSDGVTSTLPRFTSKAVITSDGFLMANFIDRNGDDHLGAFVGDASDLAKNARGLAEHLKLNETDRGELFTTFKEWIGTDYSGKGIAL